MPQGEKRKRQRPVLAYVLKHPREGLVVLDTGLSRQLAEDESTHIDRLSSIMTGAELHEGQDLPTQMRAADLKPDAVRWVILSNLRFTHAGEVEAFPSAQVVVSWSEHDAARAGGRGYVEEEFDDVSNWELVDFSNAQPLGTMPAGLDLFGDGSVMLLDARGPTEGNLAVLIRLPTRPLLLAGDLAPLPKSLRYAAVPASLHDPDAWWDRLWRLKRFGDLEPALVIIPGNDPEPILRARLPEIRVHEFAAPTPELRATPTAGARLLPGFS